MTQMSKDARRLRDALQAVVDAYYASYAHEGKLRGPCDAPVERAHRLLQHLQNSRKVPQRCSPQEFSALISNVRFGTPMQCALRDILVHGKTWKHAASTNGVSQSGILRALWRLNRLAPAPHSTVAPAQESS